MQETETLWMNGQLVPWPDAKVHVMAHALHYGSSVFEGVRLYDTPDGPRFFRLPCHLRRMVASARIHAMDLPYDVGALARACAEVVTANGLTSAYVRPLAWRGYGALGLDPTASPVECMVAAVPWKNFLGADGLERGIDVGVSSWQRLAPNTLPVLAKAGGQYLANTLVTLEAKRHGYTEGLSLGTDGTVSEGAGENVFVRVGDELLTPGAAQSILLGITRDTVLTLAREQGLSVREASLPRELLYGADEVFLTGTAAEICPVRSLDGIAIGSGGRGPVTKALQDAFFGLFRGTTEDRHGWLQDPAVLAAATGS